MSAETKAIRVFVALPVPEAIRTALREVQSELREMLPHNSTAWAKPEQMHLTLRFLGEVDSASLPKVSQSLREAVGGFGGLELVCERLGCFPDLRFPRVVWAWVYDANGRLDGLHHKVDDAVVGFATKPAETRYVGHITLARPKQFKRVDAERLAGFVNSAVSRKFGAWSGQEIELIRSELLPTGSRYTTLDVFPL